MDKRAARAGRVTTMAATLREIHGQSKNGHLLISAARGNGVLLAEALATDYSLRLRQAAPRERRRRDVSFTAPTTGGEGAGMIPPTPDVIRAMFNSFADLLWHMLLFFVGWQQTC
jgi:hypothetical protein